MKVIHKHSSVYLNSEPKAPEVSSMTKGEIAVNTNNTDPSLFIKTENDSIAQFSAIKKNDLIEINSVVSQALGILNRKSDNICDAIEEISLVTSSALNDVNFKLLKIESDVEYQSKIYALLNGDINTAFSASTFYEGTQSLSDKYQAKGDYQPAGSYAALHGNTGNTFSGSTLYGNIEGGTLKGSSVSAATVTGATAVYGATIYEGGTALNQKYQPKGDYAALHGDSGNTFSAATLYEGDKQLSDKYQAKGSYAALHGSTSENFSGATLYGNVQGGTVNGTSVSAATITGATAIYGATIYEGDTSLSQKYAAIHGNSSNTFSASTFYGNIAWSSVTSKPTTFSDYGLSVKGDAKYTSASTAGASAITVSALTKEISSATSNSTALADAYNTKEFVKDSVINPFEVTSQALSEINNKIEEINENLSETSNVSSASLNDLNKKILTLEANLNYLIQTPIRIVDSVSEMSEGNTIYILKG